MSSILAVALIGGVRLRVASQHDPSHVGRTSRSRLRAVNGNGDMLWLIQCHGQVLRPSELAQLIGRIGQQPPRAWLVCRWRLAPTRRIPEAALPSRESARLSAVDERHSSAGSGCSGSSSGVRPVESWAVRLPSLALQPQHTGDDHVYFPRVQPRQRLQEMVGPSPAEQ
jgi:hypothetical protein